MDESGRRDFLKLLAKSTAYAAPVIHTFAAPAELIGQGMASGHGHMGHGHGHGHGHGGHPAPPPGASAPWEAPPPGSGKP